MKYILIAYFFRNICAKNCRNRTVYVKIIASCRGETFFETRCISLNPCRLFVQQPPKRERDRDAHLNYYASAYNSIAPQD